MVRGFAAATRATSSFWRPGQRERLAVAPFRLPIGIESDHHDGGVGLRGRRDGALHRVGGFGRSVADAQAGERHRRVVEELHLELVRRCLPGARFQPLTSREPSPKNAVPRSHFVQLSTSSRPSRRSRVLPALVSEKVWMPLAGATICARTRADHGWPAGSGAGVLSQSNSADAARSEIAGVPEAFGVRETFDAQAGLAVGGAREPVVERRDAALVRAAALERDRHPGAFRARANAVERADRVVRRHARAAAALDHRAIRGRADHRERSKSRVERERICFVAQQRDRLGGDFACERAVLRAVDRLLGCAALARRLAEHPRAIEQSQDAVARTRPAPTSGNSPARTAAASFLP